MPAYITLYLHENDVDRKTGSCKAFNLVICMKLSTAETARVRESKCNIERAVKIGRKICLDNAILKS